MSVEGTWNTTVKSPMGDQKGTLTVNRDGEGWTGNMAGGRGSKDNTNGHGEGETNKGTMDRAGAQPGERTCEATADGDTLSGKVNAGAFGDMPLTGTGG